MEQRLANCSRMTINEKKFIENALFSELRVDGRRPFDSRSLTIKFGREDGSAEVQLGQTHVMGFVTSQLVQPYRDRPNEGTLSIYTEFSPMADPSFEPGRPGEFAVELGRVIDRGLRESRAVDTESLCILSGKLVWALRVDLHILDNGGNLVDAANIGALAALSTFRRPDCDLGGEDGQAVIVHPPEVKEPLPLIIHHLPVAVTFAIFDNGNILVIDPTHKEEVVSGGKITVTMNANGDVCAIQKAGGEGVLQSTMMQCLRIAAVKAADVTSIIKSSVEAYNTERALRKVKRHPTSVAVDVGEPDVKMGKPNGHPGIKEDAGGDKMDVEMGESSNVEIKKVQAETNILEQRLRQKPSGSAKTFIGGPSSWDPYSKGIDSSSLREPPTSTGPIMLDRGQEKEISLLTTDDPMLDEPSINKHVSSLATVHQSGSLPETGFPRTLKDAVKQKNRKKKNR